MVPTCLIQVKDKIGRSWNSKSHLSLEKHVLYFIVHIRLKYNLGENRTKINKSLKAISNLSKNKFYAIQSLKSLTIKIWPVVNGNATAILDRVTYNTKINVNNTENYTTLEIDPTKAIENIMCLLLVYIYRV